MMPETLPRIGNTDKAEEVSSMYSQEYPFLEWYPFETYLISNFINVYLQYICYINSVLAILIVQGIIVTNCSAMVS